MSVKRKADEIVGTTCIDLAHLDKEGAQAMMTVFNKVRGAGAMAPDAGFNVDTWSFPKTGLLPKPNWTI